jgi:hypothetical protein
VQFPSGRARASKNFNTEDEEDHEGSRRSSDGTGGGNPPRLRGPLWSSPSTVLNCFLAVRTSAPTLPFPRNRHPSNSRFPAVRFPRGCRPSPPRASRLPPATPAISSRCMGSYRVRFSPSGRSAERDREGPGPMLAARQHVRHSFFLPEATRAGQGSSVAEPNHRFCSGDPPRHCAGDGPGTRPG